MKKIIEQLWYGNVTPCENFGRRDAEIRALEKRYCEKMAQFESLLNNTQKENFEKLSDFLAEYICKIQKKSFCEGFSFGVRLTAEAVNEADSLL